MNYHEQAISTVELWQIRTDVLLAACALTMATPMGSLSMEWDQVQEVHDKLIAIYDHIVELTDSEVQQ